MSQGMNKVMLIGKLGHDPEMRYTPAGRPVTTFFVITSQERYTTANEKKTFKEKFNVVAWDNLAEKSSLDLRSECLVYVEGVLQSRRWVDKEGIKHNSIEIVANDILRLTE